VLVYRLTGSALLTGLTVSLDALPYLLLGLPAGAFADRLDRKTIMVGADLTSAVLLVSVPVAAALDRLTVAHLLAVAFLGNAMFVLFDAANFGALPTLVGREHIAEANALVYGTANALDVVVPAAVGALLVVLEPSSVLAFDAATFVGSALLIRAIARPMSDRHRIPVLGLGAQIGEGVAFIRAHRPVLVMTLVAATQAVAIGGLVGQLVVLLDQQLGVREGDVRLGVAWAVWGAGGVAGSAVTPWLARRLGAARTVLLGLPLSAAMAVAAGLAPTFATVVAALAAWGVVVTVVILGTINYRQEVTPEPLQSRVNTTARMLSYGGGWPIGALVAGAVAERSTARAGVLTTAAVLVAGAVAVQFSSLRAVGAGGGVAAET